MTTKSNRQAPHGQVGTRTYNCWASMIQRCTNPKSGGYRWYGARGIAVCEAWRDFRRFLSDMGECPPGLSIDRIDPSGNYEPGNCRWATQQEQQRNRSNNKLDAKSVARLKADILRGDTPKQELARKYGISPGYVSHIERGRAWKEIAPLVDWHPGLSGPAYGRAMRELARMAGV